MDLDQQRQLGALVPASLGFVLKQFLLPAVCLVGIPFPLYCIIQYKSGEFLDVVLTLAAWAVLTGVYWLPAGWLLFRWRGHWAVRVAIGYLVSVPLYFLALALVYPAFGFQFHPRSASVWATYFSATPTFFLLVLVLYLLVRRGRTLARVVRTASAAIFLVALAASLVLWARVDKYKWPAQTLPHVEVVNARIVDAAERKIVDGQNVQIENGRIVNITPASMDRSGWLKIDAQGAYLVPGLIDVHTHLQAPIRSVLGDFDFAYFLDSILGDYAPQRREYLENGVTTIRDDGGPAAHIFALRSKLARHELLGPHIFATGRLVTSPHGHPVSTIWTPAVTRQGAILAADSASLMTGLEKNYAEGPPDAVKIIYGTVGMAREKISQDLLKRAVAWANGKHLITVVHIDTTEEATAAVAAGATGVEHFATIESLPDSLVADIVAHGTFIDPTFGELRSARTLTGHKKEDIEPELQRKYAFLRRAYDSGARLTIGTDSPLVPFGEGFQDELVQYASAGFTPARILVFATLNNAAYLGKSNELGKIAPGYVADMFLVHENPLNDVHALRKPLWVMLAGQIVVGRPSGASQ